VASDAELRGTRTATLERSRSMKYWSGGSQCRAIRRV